MKDVGERPGFIRRHPIISVIAFWWISGLRLQIHPGVRVHCVDADTGLPISDALVEVHYRDNHLGLNLGKSRFGGETLSHFSRPDGWAGEWCRVRFVCDWIDKWDWRPEIVCITHPYFIPVRSEILRRPLSWLLPCWALTEEVSFKRLIGFAAEWRRGYHIRDYRDDLDSSDLPPSGYLDLITSEYLFHTDDWDGGWKRRDEVWKKFNMANIEAEWTHIERIEGVRKRKPVSDRHLKSIQTGVWQ